MKYEIELEKTESNERKLEKRQRQLVLPLKNILISSAKAKFTKKGMN